MAPRSSRKTLKIEVPPQISKLDGPTIEGIVRLTLGDKAKFGISDIVIQSSERDEKEDRAPYWEKHCDK